MNDKAQVVKNRVNNSPSPSVVEPEEPKKPKKPVYKNYAYGDNAKVLKDRVGPPPPSLAPKKADPFVKSPAAPSTAGVRAQSVQSGVGVVPNSGVNPSALNANTLAANTANSRVNTGIDTSGYKDSIMAQSVIPAVSSFLKGEVSVGGLDEESRARIFPGKDSKVRMPVSNEVVSGGRYDETSFRNPQVKAKGADTPRIGAQLGPGLTLTQDGQGTVSLFNADGTKADPSKTRLSGGNLGGTPLPAGQSPFFMKSEAAKGLGAPQPQTGIPGVTMSPTAIPGSMPGGDWTGVMNQETAMLNSVLNPGATPGGFQDFSKTIGLNPGEGKDSNYKLIEGQISDLINQNKQLMNHGYGQSGEFAKLSPTQRNSYIASNAQQIASLQNSLTGRSSLANDLVKALIGAQSDANVVGLSGQNSKDTAHITGQYGMMEAGVKARGDVAAAEQTRNDNVNDKQTKNKIAALRGSLAEMRQLQANGDTSPERQKLIDETLAALIAYGYDENDGEDYTIVPGPATK